MLYRLFTLPLAEAAVGDGYLRNLSPKQVLAEAYIPRTGLYQNGALGLRQALMPPEGLVYKKEL